MVSRGSDRVICFGDLNDILSEQEKVGGNNRSSSQLSLGRQAINICGLTDLGFQGHPFTWTKGRKGEANIQCSLDKAFSSQSYLNRFSPTKVSHLPRFGSDHDVLRIDLEADLGEGNKRRKNFFLDLRRHGVEIKSARLW